MVSFMRYLLTKIHFTHEPQEAYRVKFVGLK